MPKIGAHVSAAVSLERAFDKALEIGAFCTQIFIAPPQRWLETKHDEAEIERFIKKAEETGIGPNFIHGTYLVNLGTDNPEHLQKSINWLIYAMNMAAKLKMQGVIFHTGSHKGTGFSEVLPQVVKSLKTVIASVAKQSHVSGNEIATSSSSPDPRNDAENNTPYLILETSAGAGGSIGRDFHELGEILKQVQDDRLKICIDTQHIFAGGYDLRTLLGINDALEEFDQEIGLENLVAIHANDSKTEYKSAKDRHENIGEGLIGSEGFQGLVNHPKLKDVPFILEVPGFADNGPDKENIETLKKLIN